MGVRLTRALGYGLLDVKNGDPRVDWERLNEVCESFEVEAFKCFCEARMKEFPDDLLQIASGDCLRYHQWLDLPSLLDWLGDGDAEQGICDCFVWDPHHSAGGAFLAVNPLQPQCRRYGDLMDSCSDELLSEGVRAALRHLSGRPDCAEAAAAIASLGQAAVVVEDGFYPYQGYYEAGSGRQVDQLVVQRLRRYLERDERASADLLAGRLAGEQAVDFMARLRHVVPGAVQLMLEFTGVLTVPVEVLLPISYRFWA